MWFEDLGRIDLETDELALMRDPSIQGRGQGDRILCEGGLGRVTSGNGKKRVNPTPHAVCDFCFLPSSNYWCLSVLFCPGPYSCLTPDLSLSHVLCLCCLIYLAIIC